MDQQTMNGLTQRLVRLEQQNRWLKGWAILLVAIFGAGLLMGQSKPGTREKVIETEGFVLRDTEGKRRAMLRVTEGDPELGFYDKDGRLRAVLGLEMEGQPYLWLGSREREPRAMLGLEVDEPLFMLYGRGGEVVFSAP